MTRPAESVRPAASSLLRASSSEEGRGREDGVRVRRRRPVESVLSAASSLLREAGVRNHGPANTTLSSSPRFPLRSSSVFGKPCSFVFAEHGGNEAGSAAMMVKSSSPVRDSELQLCCSSVLDVLHLFESRTTGPGQPNFTIISVTPYLPLCNRSLMECSRLNHRSFNKFFQYLSKVNLLT